MRPAQRLTRVERQAGTRERLLDAAEALFTRNGFHATSLDAVALEAGYTKGAVYGHFESKDDLFLAVYERRVSARTEEALAGTESMSAEETLATVMNRYQKMLRRNPLWRALVIEFAAHAVRDPRLRARFAAAHEQTNVRMRSSITDDASGPAVYAVMAIIGSGMSLETLIDPKKIPDGLPARLAVQWLKGE